jgi:hypothetical protein
LVCFNGHLFHVNCLSNLKTQVCPVCHRKNSSGNKKVLESPNVLSSKPILYSSKSISISSLSSISDDVSDSLENYTSRITKNRSNQEKLRDNSLQLAPNPKKSNFKIGNRVPGLLNSKVRKNVVNLSKEFGKDQN